MNISKLSRSTKPVEGSIIDDIRKKFSSKSLSGFFSDLFKSNRRIDTESSEKTSDGDLLYNLKLVFLKDDEIATSIPAVLRISRVSEDNTDKVNMYFKLPAENYSESKQMIDVDTTEYQNIDNSKEQIGKVCWKLFDELDYTHDEAFLSQFLTEDFEDKLQFSETSSDAKHLKFLYPTSTGEEVELEVYLHVKPIDDQKVNLSFEYPDKHNLDSNELLYAENKYTGVENTHEAILDKCIEFVNSEYGVDAIEDWSPENLTANTDVVKGSSKVLRGCIQKIPNDSGYDIELTKIQASYSSSEALVDLDHVFTEEFTDSIEEYTPVTFEVEVTDDRYNCGLLESSEEISDYLEYGCNAILDEAYILLFNCLQIYYTASGKDVSVIRDTVNSYCWRLRDQIDCITTKMVESHLEVVNPLVRLQSLDIDRCYIYQDTDFESFYNTIHENLVEYLSTLEMYSCNMPFDFYLQMINWITTWKHELKYNLERMKM